MSNVKLMVTKKNSSDVATSIKPVQVLKARIKREGVRAVDSGTIVVPAKYDVEQGDEVAYIQDVCDTRYLKGIWNFQISGRDESGYKLWDNESASRYKFKNFQGSFSGSGNSFNWNPDYSDGISSTNGQTRKFAECWVLHLDGTTGTAADGATSSVSSKIRIANKEYPQQSGSNIVNLRDHFDIYIWFKRYDNSESGAKKCLFSKRDGTTGLEIFYVIPSGSDDGHIEVQATTSSTTTNINYSNPSSSPVHTSMFHTQPWTLVRVKRDSSDKIKIYVNGVKVKEQSYASSLDNTGNITIGADYNGSNNAVCYMGQCRVYTGGVLERDSDKVFTSKPQPMTMKLNGVCVRRKDKLKEKEIVINGTSKIMMQVKVTEKQRESNGDLEEGIWYQSAQTWEESTRTGNKNVLTNTTAYGVVNDLIRSADPEFRTFIDGNLSSSTDSSTVADPEGDNVFSKTISKFVANGQLVNLIKLCNLLEDKDTRFFTFPTKVLALEQATQHLVMFNNYIHGQNGIKINQETSDEMKQINNVIAIGTTSAFRATETKSSSFGTSYTTTHTPIGTITVTSDGAVLTQVPEYQSNGSATSPTSSQFYINMENKTIHMGASPTTSLKVEYDYEELSNMQKYSSDASILESGFRSITIIAPQFKSRKNLQTLANSIGENLKSVKKGYRVEVGSLINHVRENMGIFLGSGIKGFNHTTKLIKDPQGTTINKTGTTDGRLEVMGIEWFYPENRTVLRVGEYALDVKDLEQLFGQEVSGLKSSVTKTLT